MNDKPKIYVSIERQTNLGGYGNSRKLSAGISQLDFDADADVIERARMTIDHVASVLSDELEQKLKEIREPSNLKASIEDIDFDKLLELGRPHIEYEILEVIPPEVYEHELVEGPVDESEEVPEAPIPKVAEADLVEAPPKKTRKKKEPEALEQPEQETVPVPEITAVELGVVRGVIVGLNHPDLLVIDDIEPDVAPVPDIIDGEAFVPAHSLGQSDPFDDASPIVTNVDPDSPWAKNPNNPNNQAENPWVKDPIEIEVVDESEVTTDIQILGVRVPLYDEQSWKDLQSPEAMKALNTGLCAVGFDNDLRHAASSVLLTAYGTEMDSEFKGRSVASLKGFCRAETSIILEWLNRAGPDNLDTLAVCVFGTHHALLEIWRSKYLTAPKARAGRNPASESETAIETPDSESEKSEGAEQSSKDQTGKACSLGAACLNPAGTPCVHPKCPAEFPSIEKPKESLLEKINQQLDEAKAELDAAKAMNSQDIDESDPVAVIESEPCENCGKLIPDISGTALCSECEKDEVEAKILAADVTLSEEQQAAVDTIIEAVRNGETGKVFFITGKAGTGKSVLVRYLQRALSTVVIAPTGIAALNVGGMTTHKFFGLGTEPKAPGTAARIPDKYREVAIESNIILIDEISMQRVDITDCIDNTLRRTTGVDEPFGGKIMVFVGDMYQLEPIVDDNEKDWLLANWKSAFWFDALVFKDHPGLFSDVEGRKACEIVTLNLTQIFRQQGQPEFTDALNLIRVGDPRGLEYLNQRAGIPVPAGTLETPAPISITATNAKAHATNAVRLEELTTEGRTYYGTLSGELTSKDIPVNPELELKLGAQVMICKNLAGDHGDLIANGSVGVIVENPYHPELISEGFDEEGKMTKTWSFKYEALPASGPWVKLTDGRVVHIGQAEWKKVEYSFEKDKEKLKGGSIVSVEKGMYTQIPLKLAYAITSHKSQGQTLELAVLELEMVQRSHGQLYVAMSRVKSFEGLYLRRKVGKADLQIHPRVAEWMGSAKPKLDLEGL